jgi:hypothetical protein
MENLQSGDVILPLASFLRMAALYTGALTGIVSMWMVQRGVYWKAGGFVSGGIIGLISGSIIGPIIYASPDDQVMVIKVGPDAFWPALEAALIGAVMAAIFVSTISSFFASRANRRLALFAVNIVISVTLGSVCAYFGSSL